MKEIVLASNNAGKLAELQTLFVPLGLTLLPQAQLHICEAEEPFFTFVENALAKARHASLHSGLPALADDAGLCVDAFNGLPGVQTAFYCTQFGYLKSDDNNRKALLEQMANETNRRAALVSTLVAVRHPLDPEPLIAVGRVIGDITYEPRGSHGFGFDPVMHIPSVGQTMAEMPEDTKNTLSHRGQASRLMCALMHERWLA